MTPDRQEFEDALSLYASAARMVEWDAADPYWVEKVADRRKRILALVYGDTEKQPLSQDELLEIKNYPSLT